MVARRYSRTSEVVQGTFQSGRGFVAAVTFQTDDKGHVTIDLQCGRGPSAAVPDEWWHCWIGNSVFN
jgi:hypothetical protein